MIDKIITCLSGVCHLCNLNYINIVLVLKDFLFANEEIINIIQILFRGWIILTYCIPGVMFYAIDFFSRHDFKEENTKSQWCYFHGLDANSENVDKNRPRKQPGITYNSEKQETGNRSSCEKKIPVIINIIQMLFRRMIDLTYHMKKHETRNKKST